MRKKDSGYVAITSVLVIGSVLVAIGVAVVANAINGVQGAFGINQKEKTLGSIEGCAQDALLYLNENNSLPVTVTIPAGSCSVTINSQVGNNWDFSVSGSFDNHTKTIRLVVNRTTTLSVTSWLEI